MIEINSAVGTAGVIALSAAAFISVHRVRKARTRKQPTRLPDLPDFPFSLDVSPVEVLPAQRLELSPAPFVALDPEPLAPLVLTRSSLTEPATSDSARSTVTVRRVAPAGKAKSPRPVAAVVEASAPALPQEVAELISLVETMQWERALSCVQRHAGEGADLATMAAAVEAVALERLRALPESEAAAGLAGYRVLAALCPANEAYADKVAQAQSALDGRRSALLGRLTRDEDRWEPGTTWFNHPYNPAFDDVRLPLWLYIGRKEDGQTWLRLRTNWLGETRISVQGIEAVYERMSETLTDGHYKIDADALGWEWRDEAVTPYQLEVLRSLVAAEGVTLRYKGDPYAVEVDLQPEEKQAVAEMIELYDLMRTAAPVQQAALAA